MSNEIDEVVHLTELKDLQPKFDLNAYKKGLVIPLIAWLIVQILFLIVSYIDDGTRDGIGHGGFAIEILLLFGAWAAYNMIRANGSFGDGIIGGLIVGLVAEIIRLIFFGLINKPDFGTSDTLEFDLADDFMPEFYTGILLHIVGAIVAVGLLTNSLFETGGSGPAMAVARPMRATTAR